jgi:hypothetical protein
MAVIDAARRISEAGTKLVKQEISLSTLNFRKLYCLWKKSDYSFQSFKTCPKTTDTL